MLLPTFNKIGLAIIMLILMWLTINIFVSDCIKTIKDPEKPATLEDLNVVYEEGVQVGCTFCRCICVTKNYWTCDVW